jgi:hypothetical protein
VLGADTRATEGPIVCDKNCEKIHYIAPNIYCCGAGTSADTENSTGTLKSASNPVLHALSSLCESCTSGSVALSYLPILDAQPLSAAS